jgi:glycosyltransferase involved in cell wall biosynthesis
MIPFFLMHYSPWVDRIVVFDNQSTDNSKALLMTNPKVAIRDWDTNHELRDDLKTQQMNECWKESRNVADWVIVCDLDELLYHPQMDRLLIWLKGQRISICRPFGFEMVGDHTPSVHRPIISQLKEGVRKTTWDKMILFDPNQIEHINYSMGGHSAIPEGQVKLFFRQPKLKLLHYRYLNLPYILNKHARRKERLSKQNIENGWGIQYTWEEQKQKEVYFKIWQNRQQLLP